MPEYTLSGILHYLQSEWRRYERDRNAWEIERAELRARIALLEGERRGVEHVRTDLLRRIKMLEYALRQERSKGQSQGAQATANHGQCVPGTQNAGTPASSNATVDSTAKTNGERENGSYATQQDDPAPSAANVRLPPGVKDERARNKFREYLQQCLQEISYLTNPATLNPLSDRGAARPKFTLDEEMHERGSDARSEGTHHTQPQIPPSDTKEESGPSKPKEEPIAAVTQTVPPTTQHTAAPTPTAAPTGSSTETANVPTPRSVPDVQLWATKGVIHAHFDMVRALAFDSRHTGLFTGSDDSTVKYWDVPMFSGAQSQSSSDMVANNTLTLRGHTKPVTSLVYSRVHDILFSGSLDATVRFWKLPARPREKHASTPPVEGPVVSALDSIWSLALLSHESQIAAASSDGYVRMWNIEAGSFIRRIGYNGAETTEERAEGPVPTSVTACQSDERVMAVAYSNAVVKLFSVDDGHQIREIRADSTYDGTPATQINVVIAHPTLPLLATAHEDNYIHTFDMESGEKLMSLHAHTSSVSSIAMDPAGLTLMSGSHDGNIRFWDIVESRARHATAARTQGAVCFQEMRAHDSRSSEGVLDVAYHPNAPYVATAGADGNIRILG